MIAALYIDPSGPYARMPGVDPWPPAREAKRYDGPHPIVAHPPCGPWSRMRALCTKQDPSCAPRAVDQVRSFGGVLEHPAGSLLFRYCRLPLPGEFPDAFGGRTYAVRQVSWGHCCDKPTWLYVVGVAHEIVLAGMRFGGAATHRVTSGPGGPQLPSADKKVASRTPPAFAQWLVSLAERSGRS